MALDRAKFRGKVRIHGRPREQARAEIMVMKQRESYETRKRRRNFFTLLDIIAVLGFLSGIYSFYIGNFFSGLLLILVGIIILAYFTIKNSIKKNKKSKTFRSK